jgi:Baseplate J-like protein
MANPKFLQSRPIRYLNKDFNGFKRDLMKFSQAHHSGAFQDFNETSPGMALLELTAYIGDVLSFYQDMQFEELKFATARQTKNVVSIAKQLGYRPSGKRAASVVQSFFVEVPATTIGGVRVPDDTFSPILTVGGQALGPNGVTFETLDDIYFSASTPTDPRFVTGSRFTDGTGLPTYFAIRKDIDAIAGKTVSDTFSLTQFTPFLQLGLSQPNVIEVLSVVDSDGNDWYEVDYLAQDTVFTSDVNTTADSSVVPFVMKLQTVPRRFITDYDPTTGLTSLIFGSGDGVNYDDQLVPNLADMALPLPGRATFSSFNIDPQNFLKTRTLGLSPYGTSLTVNYRVGGGLQTNVPPGSVNSVGSVNLNFTSTGLDPVKMGGVVGSVQTFNFQSSQGGNDAETVSEIKANASAFFATQNRTVTREDYIARVLSLPAKYGAPYKVFVETDPVNTNALDIHILSVDANGFLTQATTTLVQNIQTYLAGTRMLTDAVNIMQADIINLRVRFGVVISPKATRTEVLSKCLATVQDYLTTDNMQIGTPIALTDLSSQLQGVLGVVSVYKLEFSNMFGLQQNGQTYSSVRFDVKANTSNKIIYCPSDSIFEVKYPIVDIAGESK